MSLKVYYLDTRALIKRYVAETGSAWIRGLADPTATGVLLTARLTVCLCANTDLHPQQRGRAMGFPS